MNTREGHIIKRFSYFIVTFTLIGLAIVLYSCGGGGSGGGSGSSSPSPTSTSYYISGYVKTSGSSPVSGVGIGAFTSAGLWRSSTTSSSGYYYLGGLGSRTYSVKPIESLANKAYTFSPPSREITIPPSWNNVNFTATPVPTDSITVTSPNGGETFTQGGRFEIKWTSTGNISEVIVDLYKGSQFDYSITPWGTDNDGSVVIYLSQDQSPRSDYKIKIYDASNSSIYDWSNGYFTISEEVEDFIKIISPNGGENWEKGQPQTIRWSSAGNISTVKIELYKGVNLNRTLGSNIANVGSYTWTIPDIQEPDSDFRIRMSHSGDYSLGDYSDGYFTIAEPSGGGQGLEGLVVHNDTTDTSGRAYFIDNGTGEDVQVYVTNVNITALSGIQVQFLDSDLFEVFILQDPVGIYDTTMKIYPHNSFHSITMYVDSDVPRYHEETSDSAEGEADRAFAEYIRQNGEYGGRRTPEQLDAETDFYLYLIRIFSKPVTLVFDTVGKLGEISGSISTWEEPDYYEVYYVGFVQPITTIVRTLTAGASGIDETTLDGDWYVTENITPSWYMNITLASDGTFYEEEFYDGYLYATATGTWSFDSTRNDFILEAVGGMNGIISGSRYDFYVDGYWGDGSPGYFRWQRQ